MIHHLRRHADRTSVSFYEAEGDVPWIVTVTFDNRMVDGMDEATIFEVAKVKLRELPALLDADDAA